MRRHFVLAAVIGAVTLAASAAALPAQQLAAPPKPVRLQDSPLLARRQAFTVQPISIIVGFYSAEYERAISRSTTLGIGAGYLDRFIGEDDPSDPHYLSVDAKLRYYPGEQPLRGFSFGVAGGYSSVSSRDCVYDPAIGVCTGGPTDRDGGPGFGFQLDYNWLLGRNQNFVVALGVGAKRLFIKTDNRDVTVAYPTARVSVGLAF